MRPDPVTLHPLAPMRSLIPALALLLAAACGTTDPATDALSFATDGTRFEPGGPITVELSNGSDDTVGYNFCQRYWERKVGVTWERFEETHLCTPAFANLAAGATARETLGVPYGLVPGTYRVSAAVRVGDESAPMLSNEFEIEAGLQR